MGAEAAKESAENMLKKIENDYKLGSDQNLREWIYGGVDRINGILETIVKFNNGGKILETIAKKNQKIMCYFTKKVLNKRFLPNRKNRWNPPVCTDERFRYVEVECGHCFECRKKKRREWRIRNYEQLKETPRAVFFTGTVSPQRYEHICNKYGYKNDGSQDNEIITKIHRLSLERIRKQTGKSVKHWCVTEKGHTNTRRIHLHGLFYAREGQTKWQLTKLLYENWIDGYKYYGRYVNEKTINYVSKYMTKKDEDNPNYISIVLCSKGLGANYAKENQHSVS